MSKINTKKMTAENSATSVGNNDNNARQQWFGTWNNYSEENYVSFVRWHTDNFSKFIIARETGKLNGTPHLQFWFNLKKRVRRSTLYRQWKGAWFDPELPDMWKSITYCRKDKQYIEFLKPKKTLKQIKLDAWKEHDTAMAIYIRKAEDLCFRNKFNLVMKEIDEYAYHKELDWPNKIYSNFLLV